MIKDNFKLMHEAGYHVFGLYGAKMVGDGLWECECENPHCTAYFKHPRPSSWQHVPLYSEEQIEVIEATGQIDTGFGVLMKELFVVDVDARNGGVESLAKLEEALGFKLEDRAGYYVMTGSGGGSCHYYFKAPEPPIALAQTLEDYPGIDFKSTGYVVGAGSMHISGNRYEPEGLPEDITEMPEQIVKMLEKKNHRRTDYNGQQIDITDNDLESIVMSIDVHSAPYEKWVHVGMALHQITGGSESGLMLWDKWSAQQSDKYKGIDDLIKRWTKFSTEGNIITFATLMHYAKKDGYIEPVTFTPTELEKAELFVAPEVDSTEFNTDYIDIRRPPGFAGELTQWINDQCLYPRENMAAAAALFVMSCCGGMRHRDVLNGLSANIIAFCVTASGSGKEAVNGAINDLLYKVKLLPAVHGRFKSEQEAIRNLLRHQAAFYTIDELGIELKKVQNASRRGGASYLEGLFGVIMSAYSKADGILPISGDLKEEIKNDLLKEYGRLNAKAEKGAATVSDEKRMDQLLKDISNADNGIVHPFLSIFGATTPVTFDDIIDFEMATNGFIARSIIMRDAESNPRRKENFRKRPLDPHILTTLENLYWGSLRDDKVVRVESMSNPPVPIETTPEAQKALDHVYEYFYEVAEAAKETTGLEAIPRRGWEIASKISLITAMPTKVRGVQDVLYGFAVAKQDIQSKMEMALANYQEATGKKDASSLVNRIYALTDKEAEITVRVIVNRLPQYTEENIEEALSHMVDRKMITVDRRKARNGRMTEYVKRV